MAEVGPRADRGTRREHSGLDAAARLG